MLEVIVEKCGEMEGFLKK